MYAFLIYLGFMHYHFSYVLFYVAENNPSDMYVCTYDMPWRLKRHCNSATFASTFVVAQSLLPYIDQWAPEFPFRSSTSSVN
jgi:hypothetical protein